MAKVGAPRIVASLLLLQLASCMTGGNKATPATTDGWQIQTRQLHSQTIVEGETVSLWSSRRETTSYLTKSECEQALEGKQPEAEQALETEYSCQKTLPAIPIRVIRPEELEPLSPH